MYVVSDSVTQIMKRKMYLVWLKHKQGGKVYRVYIMG